MDKIKNIFIRVMQFVVLATGLMLVAGALVPVGRQLIETYKFKNGWRGCPEATHRVMQSDEIKLINSPKFKEQIAAIDAKLPLVAENKQNSEAIANQALW